MAFQPETFSFNSFQSLFWTRVKTAIYFHCGGLNLHPR